MIKGIWYCVPHIYNPVEQEVMAAQFHAPSHPGVLKNVNMMGIYLTDILLIRISRDTNNCAQRVFEKNIYFIMRFFPIFNCFSSMKGSFFVIWFYIKDQKGLIMHVYFQQAFFDHIYPWVPNNSDHLSIYYAVNRLKF